MGYGFRDLPASLDLASEAVPADGFQTNPPCPAAFTSYSCVRADHLPSPAKETISHDQHLDRNLIDARRGRQLAATGAVWPVREPVHDLQMDRIWLKRRTPRSFANRRSLVHNYGCHAKVCRAADQVDFARRAHHAHDSGRAGRRSMP